MLLSSHPAQQKKPWGGGETAINDPVGAKNNSMEIYPLLTEKATTPIESAKNATEEPTTTKEVGDTAGQPLGAQELGDTTIAENPDEKNN
jgi:hypothetical protein